MPAKRKHLDISQIHESPYSKRSRRSTLNQTELAQTIIDSLKSSEDEEGRLVCDCFLKLPSKRSHSDYYEMIEDPIDLNRITQRIRMDDYRDLEVLTTDIQLMVDNAKLYYAEDTQQHKDANVLLDNYFSIKSRVLGEGGDVVKAKKIATADVYETMKEIYESIVTETDEEGRVIAELFMKLPDQSANPGYYDVIKDPIDMRTIFDRIDSKEYKSMNDLKKDVRLLTKNATIYNKPNSQVYEDAGTIKRLFDERMNEFDRIKKSSEVSGVKTSARIKVRKSWSRHVDKTSKARMETQEKHDASIPKISAEDHQAQLYNEVVNYKNDLGFTISDPFLRLPNRRFYPTYYEEIKNPISLKTIRKKIIAHKYQLVHELSEDLQLLFNNALHFNLPSAQIYKDAVTLKEFVDERTPTYIEKEAAAPSTEEPAPQPPFQDPVPQPQPASITETEENTSKKKRRKKKIRGSSVQGHLHQIYEAVLGATDDAGREMITLFLEKPSRRDYPDYYKLISDPIDMRMIDKKVRSDKYVSVEEMLEDFRLMFNNARQYNEPGSEVYLDANALDKVLVEKVRALGPVHETIEDVDDKSMLEEKSLEWKLDQLYTRVRDFVDVTSRVICDIFTHLPSKQELPDYYKIIKKPMDMDRILHKSQNAQYSKMEDMMSDMLLMFENACIYNEPGSVIYKDALILHNLTVKTFMDLKDTNQLPHLPTALHLLFVDIFIALLDLRDPTSPERRVCESLFDIAPLATTAIATNQLTLEVIARNLRNRRYKRLDVFQDQLFQVFQLHRASHRSDSRVYEDVVAMQKLFVSKRDEVCSQSMTSLASDVTAAILDEQLEAELKQKREQEQQILPDADQQRIRELMTSQSASEAPQIEGDDIAAGDFVYLNEMTSEGSRSIAFVEKFFDDVTQQKQMFVRRLLHPSQVPHAPHQHFLVRELFLSDVIEVLSASLICARCHVMSGNQFFEMQTSDFAADDVYVCEARYHPLTTSFTRLKQLMTSSRVQLTNRVTPLRRARHSIADGSIQQSENREELRARLISSPDPSWPYDVIPVARENIHSDTQNPNSEATYYVQLWTGTMWVKLGDCVYVRDSRYPETRVARVERLWTDASGNIWFRGPWFVECNNTKHEPTRTFYLKELCLSSEESTNMFRDVIGKCVVMTLKDYQTSRPTETGEIDVYIFESRFSASDKTIKRMKNQKPYQPPLKVVDDEIYHFSKPLDMAITSSDLLQSMVNDELVHRATEMKVVPKHENMDMTQQLVHTSGQYQQAPLPALPDASVQPQALIQGNFGQVVTNFQPRTVFNPQTGITNYQLAPSPQFASTPDRTRPPSTSSASSTKRKTRGGHSTGYILFASYCHPRVRSEHPDLAFGEISKMVGEEWRNLDDDKKRSYEERAKEQTAKMEAEGKLVPKKSKKRKKEAMDDVISAPGTPQGTPLPVQQPPQTFQQQQQPVANSFVQVVPQPSQPVPPQVTIQQQAAPTNGVHVRKRGPLFIRPPPKPERVLMHSDAYFRYIEKLDKDSKSVGNWEQALSIQESDVIISREDEAKLPADWLGNGKGRHPTIKSALWSLRDYMMKDALLLRNVVDWGAEE